MSLSAPRLEWRRTWPDSRNDFVLNAHHASGLIENVGRIHYCEVAHHTADDYGLWYWSMYTNPGQPRFVVKPKWTKSGRCHTRQEAVDALKASWAREEAWRAELRRASTFTHGCWSRNHLRAAFGFGWSDLHKPGGQHWWPALDAYFAIDRRQDLAQT